MRPGHLPRAAPRGSNNRNPLRLEQDTTTEPPARRDLAVGLALLAAAVAVFGLAVWKLAELAGL